MTRLAARTLTDMPFVIIVLFGFVFFSIVSAHQRAVQAAWQDAAKTLGLQASSGGLFTRPTLTGRIGSVDVHVTTEKRGKENVYTVYSVRFPAATSPFQVTREHLFSGITKLFGVQDVVVGDHRFDSSFIVKATDPNALVAYMTPSRRVALLSYSAANRSMTASESSVQARWSGTDSRTDRIVSRVRTIVGLAQELGDSRESLGEIDRAFEDRLAGDLGRSVERLGAETGRRPDDYGARIAHVEGMVASEATAEARSAAEDLVRELPEDERLEGLMREITALESDASTSLDTTPAGRGETPPDEVFRDLFGTTKLSHQTAELFRLRYRNTPVDWQGTVRSSRPFRSDPDFGSHPGVKTVVTVAEIETDLYGNTTIDAVVEFPPETDLRRDQVITFTGRLVKVDPLMRNLYVAEARLVED